MAVYLSFNGTNMADTLKNQWIILDLKFCLGSHLTNDLPLARIIVDQPMSEACAPGHFGTVQLA